MNLIINIIRLKIIVKLSYLYVFYFKIINKMIFSKSENSSKLYFFNKIKIILILATIFDTISKKRKHNNDNK